MANSPSRDTLISGSHVISNNMSGKQSELTKRIIPSTIDRIKSKSNLEDYINKPHYMYPTFQTINTKTTLMNPGVHKLLN